MLSAEVLLQVLLFILPPARDLRGLWPAAVFDTGRVSDALISCGQLQIRVIGIYGYHSALPNSMGLNEILLDEAFRQVQAHNLPTILAGDFNVELGQLSCWEVHSNLGLRDLGVKFATLAGAAPENTYRGISRIDYCVVNQAA